MVIPEKEYINNNIIGLNDGLFKTYQTILSVAKFNINILLIGETGTGKELLADFIHKISTYSPGNIIKINCAALPDNLLESELFGYERGAFTSACHTKKGKIELADNSTLFLDEIGEIKLELQAKLLRVLQTKEVSRIGSNISRRIDFRLICATNRDLITDVRNNRFREDLYYRISTFPIIIPPLRERKEDIKKITDYILDQICLKTNLIKKKIEKKAFELLKLYNWPGNVRELENVLFQALVFSQEKKKITTANISNLIKTKGNKTYEQIIKELMLLLISEKLSLKTINSDIIKNLFEHFDFNVTQIQKATCMSKDQIYRYKHKLSQS